MKTVHRATRTYKDTKAGRQQRQAAVARIEAALPHVKERLRGEVEEVLASSEKRSIGDLEFWADRAEGWFSSPDLTGEALAAQAKQDANDLYGPR